MLGRDAAWTSYSEFPNKGVVSWVMDGTADVICNGSLMGGGGDCS